MLLVGLTGGIGSGKSTVASMLAARGAVVVDADAITRELQAPGTEVFAAIVGRFGDTVVADDGTLDRKALAAMVFGRAGDGEDDDTRRSARKDLEAIVHPAVGAEMLRRLQAAQGSDAVVVYDVPLLVESAKTGYSAVLVVDVDPEVAVARLVAHRGFDAADARARVASQASRADRTAVADRVLDNSGALAALEAQVDEAWAWIATLPHPDVDPTHPTIADGPVLATVDADAATEVAAFLAPLQADPATFVAYLADEADAIAAELDALDTPWWSLARTGRDERGTLAGLAFADIDEDLGRAWIHGPWTVPDRWDDLARPLLDAVIGLLPDRIDDIELSGHAEHGALRALAAGIGLEASPIHHVLSADAEIAGSWPTPTVTVDGPEVLDPTDSKVVAVIGALHDELFPTTYRTGAQLIGDVATGAARGWVARRADGLLGYLFAQVQPDGNGYIDFVGVTTEARGEGWGARLVRTAVLDLLAGGAPRVSLTVDETNPAAIALYRSLGFVTDLDIVGYRTPGRRAT